MYRKELFQKAIGVTVACMLTIGLNATVSNTPKHNISDSASRAQAVVVSVIEDDMNMEEVTLLPSESIEPNEAANVADGTNVVTVTNPLAAQGAAEQTVDLQAAQAANDVNGAAPAAEANTDAAAQEAAKQKEAKKFQNTGISIAKDYVNIRKAPSTDSKIKGKLYRGSAAKIVKTKGKWVKIKSGSVTGYIRKDYLAIGDKAAKVADKFGKTYAVVKKGTDTLNVREKKSTEAGILKQIGDGDSYVVKSEGSEWVKIKLSGSETGYVSKDYVSTKFRFKKAVSIKEEQAAERSSSTSGSTSASGSSYSSRGSSVASYALQFIGNPYVWGGSSLTHGADCSGFTMSVYAHFGYGLPHSSGSQSGCGRAVSLNELQPGDLVFYRHGGSIGHVAMYIGGGRVVHAQCKRTGITTSSVNYRTPACARRIIG
ncbi:MAG: C40 family peptidase [Lachnospiraceae bacterium]|nr:C40 family peptidase [Lachnospiraceae bacterium]